MGVSLESNVDTIEFGNFGGPDEMANEVNGFVTPPDATLPDGEKGEGSNNEKKINNEEKINNELGKILRENEKEELIKIVDNWHKLISEYQSRSTNEKQSVLGELKEEMKNTKEFIVKSLSKLYEDNKTLLEEIRNIKNMEGDFLTNVENVLSKNGVQDIYIQTVVMIYEPMIQSAKLGTKIPEKLIDGFNKIMLIIKKIGEYNIISNYIAGRGGDTVSFGTEDVSIKYKEEVDIYNKYREKNNISDENMYKKYISGNLPQNVMQAIDILKYEKWSAMGIQISKYFLDELRTNINAGVLSIDDGVSENASKLQDLYIKNINIFLKKAGFNYVVKKTDNSNVFLSYSIYSI